MRKRVAEQTPRPPTCSGTNQTIEAEGAIRSQEREREKENPPRQKGHPVLSSGSSSSCRRHAGRGSPQTQLESRVNPP